MLMNVSENFWILLCCLLTSSFAILAWIRAIIAEHKTERLSEQLALYVEASLNMSLQNNKPSQSGTGSRRHVLTQAQACIKNGLAPADIQVEFGLREEELKLMQVRPGRAVKGFKHKLSVDAAS